MNIGYIYWPVLNQFYRLIYKKKNKMFLLYSFHKKWKIAEEIVFIRFKKVKNCKTRMFQTNIILRKLSLTIFIFFLKIR